ncbi:MAG: oxygen-dependent coproporphyrinogen oxidase [Zetaproteobacteria bacterium]|nr:oxygen-dependent coproporphyrinogen oxidase [Zetaproteobacteria bacterium]
MSETLWTSSQVAEAQDFFRSVQERLMAAFAQVDPEGREERESWQRPAGGGGTMAVMRGPVVEKAGANFSCVHGDNYPTTESEHAGKSFMASGVSSITHMANPHAPIGHMNVRLIQVGEDKFWFGGGADLTPCIRYEEDTQAFHAALRDACGLLDSEAYARYSKWCDEYFYIQHRQEVRGVGGVFFDYLEGSFAQLFPFVQAVANAYVEVFPRILQKRCRLPFTEEEKEQQLFWRGRYAEFNLVYDRGTRFGLLTGGNTKAIFVSLPPVVKW